jgi:hypothetical protein
MLKLLRGVVRPGQGRQLSEAGLTDPDSKKHINGGLSLQVKVRDFVLT